MNHFLRLSYEQKYQAARRAVAIYNRTDENLQSAFDRDPEAYRVDGKPGTHAAFEDGYALELVDRALEQLFGHRKAFVEGWGVGDVVRAEVRLMAIAIRADYLAAGICFVRAGERPLVLA